MGERASAEQLMTARLGRWWHPMVAPTLALGALCAVGVFGLMALQGWTLGEAIWMIALTISTVGYGEVRPLDDLGRAFMTVFLLVALVLGGATIARLVSVVSGGQLVERIRLRRLAMHLDRLQGHHIVIGWGRLGREVVSDLVHHGAEVVIIDPQPGTAPVPHGAHLILGDATRDDVLQAAGISRARAVAIATPSDAVNVFLALSVRQLNPLAAISVRLEDEDAAEKARRAGANRVFLPYHLSGTRMAQAMLRPRASQFVEQIERRNHAGLRMEDVQVPAGSPLIGRLDHERLRREHGVVVVAVHGRAQDDLLVAADSDTLSEGDTLVVVSDPERVDAFLRWAKG